MKNFSNQSNATNIALFLVGTTSMLFGSQFDTENIISPDLYNSKQVIAYSLKHEKMQKSIATEIEECLIDIPIVKKIGVKINKFNIIPLEFTYVEDSKGFIE